MVANEAGWFNCIILAVVTTRRGLLGQVVDPLPWSLVFVDDVSWVLPRTTGLLPAMTIRRINGPKRRWRVLPCGRLGSSFMIVLICGRLPPLPVSMTSSADSSPSP
ncbi:hypothetical protein BJ165DRAFT_1492800 [Panaeolus papilionaceus]|nr:hypothetical protein BJ165DRAFT_1492800 [Panaeolus papilionaceus]